MPVFCLPTWHLAPILCLSLKQTKPIFFFFGVFCFSQKDYSLVREMSLTQGLQENL